MDGSGRGRRIAGRYELQAALGEGSMGIVWLAEDGLLQRHVAVKELRVGAGVLDSDRPALRAQLLREARAAGRLNHPGATIVHDVVEDDGDAYIVMELVRAPSLDAVVRDRGPVDPALAARIGLALLDTLDAAHAAGIVHRDVKPSNVLITAEGAVKLTDFGVASVQEDPTLTARGTVLGSPAWMAPEQARADRVGPAADIWAVGATLYFAVEGAGPFDRDRLLETLTAVVNEDPRPPRRAGPLVPALAAALVKDPAGRAGTAALRDLLAPVATGNAYGPAQVGGEARTGLREVADRAAQELGPVVAALLAQRRQPAEPPRPEPAAASPAPATPPSPPAPGSPSPSPSPSSPGSPPASAPSPRMPPVPAAGAPLAPASARDPAPEPRPSLVDGLRRRLQQAWKVAVVLVVVLGLSVLGLVAWLGFELLD